MTLIAKSGTPSLASPNPTGGQVIPGLKAGAGGVAAGDACYIDPTLGTALPCDGTAADEKAVFAGAAAGDAQAGEAVTLYRGVTFHYGAALTPGALYYLAATAGRLDTAPTTGGQSPVAMAIDATRILWLETHANTVSHVITGNWKFASLTGATKTVSLSESGTLFELNRAGGIDVALPAIDASSVGATFKFRVGTAVSGDAYTITAQAADLLTGCVTMVDTDSSNALSFARPDGSDDLITTLNATTSGGGVTGGGDTLTFTAISATRWLVEGMILHTGNVTTPFS